MELHWSDVQRIAEELYDADPDLDAFLCEAPRHGGKAA